MTELHVAQDSAAVQRILEERARLLARPPETPIAGDTTELVILVLGGERYGVDIRRVREIHILDAALTPVPGVPSYWVGLLNVRGRLYPILDLGDYLSLSAPLRNTGRDGGSTHAPKVALVSAAGQEVGLLVDDVPQVRRVTQAEIGPPLTEGGSAKRRIITGITHDLLALLDMETLLSDPKLTVQDSAA